MIDGEGRVFVDTNILLRLQHTSDETELTRAVVDQFRRQGRTLYIALQNVAEFWNVCTRPQSRNGFGLSTVDTMARLALIEGMTELLLERPVTYTLWRNLLTQQDVSGVQVHDARLVAMMQTHGIDRILTHNGKDFLRYPGIEVIAPQNVRTIGD